MAPVGIVGLGAYVPPDVMTNDDWAEIVDTSDEWITTKTGIEERRIAADDVCTSDLAVIACQQAMDEAGIGPGDVDMLILATSSPDVPLSSTAGITQRLPEPPVRRGDPVAGGDYAAPRSSTEA